MHEVHKDRKSSLIPGAIGRSCRFLFFPSGCRMEVRRSRPDILHAFVERENHKLQLIIVPESEKAQLTDIYI